MEDKMELRKPITELRRRMIRELRLRNFAKRTEQAYICAVKGLAEFYMSPPNLLNVEKIKNYLLYLINQGLSYSTINVKICGIRFFYLEVLGWKRIDLPLPPRKRPKHLPTVLSAEEVLRLISAPKDFRDRVILKTAYSTGMRRAEIANLKVADIESDRMLIRVNLGKGAKDRYTLLSQTLLDDLRTYYRKYHIETYLFPGQKPNRPLDKTTVGKIYTKAKELAGIKKEGCIHTLRHSFATHLLDAGVDIRFIKELLGHKNISTTTVYLHVSKKNFANIPNPLDLLPIDHELIKPKSPPEK